MTKKSHARVNHRSHKRTKDPEEAVGVTMSASDGVPDELPMRDSDCVGRHVPNCHCTGTMREPIDEAADA